MKEKITVKKSGIDNRGIFASEKIKKGETICFLKGEEKNIPQMRKEVLSGKERINDPLQIGKRKYIDIEEPYLYFNHSCNPNAGIKGKNELFAIKDIKKGEEITFDYSTTSWEENWNIPNDEEFSMVCKCGSKNCRKIVREFYHLDKKTKLKYLKLGALPDFIISKFKNN
ncbi:SET domain-containing protein-lysine N-methyltransferase [Candidatus Pacearchaeota archaeon]|nr:SET domain-containing protein-lysine N-methyltransferase [Candidatus Pacearchaeota archaeon]